jgi:MFS family permease
VANGLNGQARNLARLLGSGLGGVLAAAGGVGAIAIADAITFALAAALVLRIATPGRAVAEEEPDETPEDLVRGRVATLVDEWRDGFRTTVSNRVVRTLVIMLLITSTGEGIMGTLFAPYVRHVLHGSAQVYGVISGVQAIGGLVGGVMVATMADRWSPVTMVWLGSILFGLVDLAIFLYPLVWVNPWPAAAGMILVGLPGAVVVAGTMTLFQRNTTDEHRGRVFSLIALAQAVSVVVGSTLAGFLGGPSGIMPILALQGAGYVVAGLLALSLLGVREASLDLSPTRS